MLCCISTHATVALPSGLDRWIRTRINLGRLEGSYEAATFNGLQQREGRIVRP